MVVYPIGIDKLLPGWREDSVHPFKTEVTAAHFLLFGPAHPGICGILEGVGRLSYGTRAITEPGW